MKKYISPSKYYELYIPESWTYSQADNIVSFYNEGNGVGALQISSYSISEGENVNITVELAEMLSDKLGASEQDILPKITVSNNLAQYHFTDDDKYWEYYMLYKNDKLLFITYNCKKEDQHIEKGEINKIVESIQLGNVSK